MRLLAESLLVGLACGAAFAVVLGPLLWYIVHSELKTLSSIKCPSCGMPYGMASARQAKRTYADQCQAEREKVIAEKDDFVLIDFDNKWPVRCELCGHSARYDFSARELLPPA